MPDTPTTGGPTNAPIPPTPSPFTTTLVSVIVVFLGLATIALGLRIYCARTSMREKWFTIDLMLIIASLIVTFGCVLTTVIGGATLGLDYTNNKMDPVQGAQFLFKVGSKTNEKVRKSVTSSDQGPQIYFSDVITTTVASGLCKISILEFYKRLFIWNPFAIVCNVGIFLVSSWMIGTFFVGLPARYSMRNLPNEFHQTQLFSTSPISSAWHPDRQLLDANYDYPTALLAIFGIGIVLDFLVLCLPLRPIWQLQLTLANKIKVSLILWLGIFCVVAASVRFYYSYRQLSLVFVTTAQEKGTITVKASLWSKIEPSASIIAACLPTYGPLFSNFGMSSMIRSTLSFFSISSRTAGSSNFSKDANYNNHPGDKNGKWHELTPSNKTEIESSSTQSLTRPENGDIRVTSELRTTHQTTHQATNNARGAF
ncbi:hypothetical protein EJ04DRAFT_566122 [Polyplosphaeria fusca]|uniref:Rhodopsin domain-containing protein n=1 Tax=Polyplosphaeria fusca TaxID=682080 RepID=A0A9P4UZA3_9PLEO|nr:hypothetical protein EJ04DRAFT_566122 [Polyplosphaeria fusca]